MEVGTLVNRGKTIELDPELYEKFQSKADLKGQTVKSYVQELLSMYLDREIVLEQLPLHYHSLVIKKTKF